MSPRKKRPAKKSAKKSPKASSSSTRRGRKRSKALPGLGTVRRVGKRTWKTLKSTTAQVVEGVKETLGG